MIHLEKLENALKYNERGGLNSPHTIKAYTRLAKALLKATPNDPLICHSQATWMSAQGHRHNSGDINLTDTSDRGEGDMDEFTAKTNEIRRLQMDNSCNTKLRYVKTKTRRNGKPRKNS